jgi:predicted lipid-binding transport protein (Tim44 family)
VALATVGPGTLGAVIGLLIFGLLGLILGGLLLAFIGALIINSFTRTETTVRIRLADREMYFTDNTRSPEQLRVAMSGVRRAIAEARNRAPGGPFGASGDAAAGEDGSAGGAAVPGGAAGSAEGTIADQLAKLAGLLQQGLLTREEFDRLKARLIS